MQDVKRAGQKYIRFLDSVGRHRFCVLDGSAINLIAENGDNVVKLCHYLSSNDVEIDGDRWTVQEFIQEMKLRNIVVRPLEE
ncbi:MAG: hypothetical protein PHC41_12785 [Lachnospiraceae bacterium]|nr:hypothetical protein [Lachnospiraceae bacterium]MDD3617082.1 hypothetical protein [Lachnospiraceae bacterium]